MHTHHGAAIFFCLLGFLALFLLGRPWATCSQALQVTSGLLLLLRYYCAQVMQLDPQPKIKPPRNSSTLLGWDKKRSLPFFLLVDFSNDPPPRVRSRVRR